MEKVEKEQKSKEIIKNSAKMKKVCDLVDVIAPLDVSVYITGEDGCGKNRLAEYIHIKSGRVGKFIIISPVEFNDNIEKVGFQEIYNYFKKAELGTIYIPNICLAHKKLQDCFLACIIKILEELKSNAPRFITSTNQDLSELARQKKFSQSLKDCFSIVMNMPPLRERKEDIRDITTLILNNFGYNNKISLSQEAEEIIKNYDWPGNVRELVSAMHHSINHTDNGIISPLSLPKDIRENRVLKARKNTISELYQFAKGILESGVYSSDIDPYFEYTKAVEIPLIKAALDISKGNKSEAANLIKINRNTLNKKIKLYNLEKYQSGRV